MLKLARMGTLSERRCFMVKTLLLWDIDGTLIDSGGAGERALRSALKQEFGIADTFSWLDWAGRTDPWIARNILEYHRLGASRENIARLLDGYLAAVTQEMINPGAHILRGVQNLLDAIARHPSAAQGLLTGNLKRGAKIKLEHFDLWRYFPFGAFADDHELRDELGPHAMHRAGEHHRIQFTPDRVVVIGDTPHDIACGRALGARTVAVATGKFSMTALQDFKPDLLLADLSDQAAFLSEIGIAVEGT